MRNKFSGLCYFCGNLVQAGEGHFERAEFKKWLTIHAECVFRVRKLKEDKIEVNPNSFQFLINQSNYQRVKTNLGVFERQFKNQHWSLWHKLGVLTNG